ncbi:MAG TPA: HAD family hydrolase [Gemmatimonadaceae bacterium]|jgi:HAD superfamily hydrolase (TIGR01549 family)
MSTRRCDAIVFDVGGTLLDVPRDPQERALERIAHLGAARADAFREAVADAIAEWRRAGGNPAREDLPVTWARHYEHALRVSGFPGDCAAAAHLIEEMFLEDGWVLFPDVVSLLERLRAGGWTLGVISNWPATLEATLERAGIREYFSMVVCSGVVGYAKPHPEIFRIAARRLGLEPSCILYIGDSVEHDLVGGSEAGFQAVLLDRCGKHDGHASRIQGLDMLETILESASASDRPNER